MFAPHCPACRRRVLLGPDRLVRLAWDGTRRAARLRCFCGEVLDWDQRPAADDAVSGATTDGRSPSVPEPQPAAQCVLAGSPAAQPVP